MAQAGVAYIPTDRYYALVEKRALPAREQGSALFADISGFTPLTEAYARLLGPRLGAEELTRQLNYIYDALIAEVRRYGGSVISFSGDAILCWFGVGWPRHTSDPYSHRAVACGAAMLRSIDAFSALVLPDGSTVSVGIKVSVATGAANRFLVGNPALQYFDLLAGEPVERTAIGEHLIGKGEFVVDSATASKIGDLPQITEWRTAEPSGERFGVVKGLRKAVQPVAWQDAPTEDLDRDTLRSWMLPQVFQRLQDGAGEFQAELRPAVALFIRFVGIDFNDPAAGGQLDQFLRWIQEVLRQYDGTLIHVTLGDKGSYLYASFGVPTAHEDDARRAVAAALELRRPPPDLEGIASVQLGISQGTMRVGAYGGPTRRTYSSIGDEANVAARLMQQASAGEVLAISRIQRATETEFNWESLPPLLVKGKTEPIALARLVNRFSVRQQAAFSARFVGRDIQLRQLVDFLKPLWAQRFAGIAYVVGEAGMGKSRLLFELRAHLQTTLRLEWVTCICDEVFRDSFQPFRQFLREYFNQSPEYSRQENGKHFYYVLDLLINDLRQDGYADLGEKLHAERTFLAALLDLRWEDSLYSTLEPRQRLERTIQAITTLIQAQSLRHPIILHVDDGAWLDTDSAEVLKNLCYSPDNYPIGIVVTSRNLDDVGLWTFSAEAGVRRETCTLKELSPESIQELARELLSGDISTSMAGFLREKTNGNPFFVEQLVLDLRERNLLIQQAAAVWSLTREALVEVPSTVNAVLIARLDRLVTKVRSAVQWASVLGQEFAFLVLHRMFADDSDTPFLVQQAEAAAIWAASREGFYQFRHAFLRDAAYDMQLSDRRRELHYKAATAIETVYGENAGIQATELAYHYEQAKEVDCAAIWHTTAGDNAMKIYALENGIFHFRKALECWETSQQDVEDYQTQRLHVLLELGNALRWRNRTAEAMETLKTAYGEAIRLNDPIAESNARFGLGAVQYDEGDFRAALEQAACAEERATGSGNSVRLRAILELKCWCLFRLGDLEAARLAGERAVEVSEALDERGQLAQSLSVLGLVLMASGDYQRAIENLEHALSIALDPMDIVGITNNLGMIAIAQGDFARAAMRFEEALVLARQHNIAEAEIVFRSNLGGAHVGLGDFQLAERELREVIDDTGDSGFSDLSETYRFLAEALLGQDRLDEAMEAAKRALALGLEAAAPEFVAVAWRVLGQIAAQLARPLQLTDESTGEIRDYRAEQCYTESVDICEETGLKSELPRTVRAWALYELESGHEELAGQLWRQALDAFKAAGATKEVDAMTAKAYLFSLS